MQKIIKEVFKQNQLKEEDTALIVYDLDLIGEKIKGIQNTFPSDTLHAIAVKANPLLKILKRIAKAGVGLETASYPEMVLAEKTGIPPNKIVFDSPAKTHKELEYALKKGIHINADSFQELDRIAELLKTTCAEKSVIKTTSQIGLRINPQVGMGSIEATSVSGKFSKFGVPINSNQAKITAYYLANDWLTGIHLHVGSQGYPIEKLVQGVKTVYNLAQNINKQLIKENKNRQIKYFDIGGGLPVAYRPTDKPITVQTYYQHLKTAIPTLFLGEFKLITEFGRYIHANTAFALSKIEYVKKEPNYNIIINHLGADFMLRKCYNPTDWHHEITLVNNEGNTKNNSPKEVYTIAGPLCFSGDLIAKDVHLPIAKSGDFIVINDVGAYTLSMWSRYNSRQIPKVVGWSDEVGEFEVLKGRVGVGELIKFWEE